MKSSLILQRNSLSTSEFLCDLVKGATFCLRQVNPGEGEGRESCRHEEQVNVPAAHFLCGQHKHVSCNLKGLKEDWGTAQPEQAYKPTSNGGKSSASRHCPPQWSMLVKAMAVGLPGWSNSSAAMNQEIGPGPNS